MKVAFQGEPGAYSEQAVFNYFGNVETKPCESFDVVFDSVTQIEMDLVLASGETRTCSPSIEPDLFWATCGGMGLTGIITRVKFDMKKIETSYIRQRQVKAKNLDEILRLFDEYKHYTYSVAWIDCLKKGSEFGRSILILGEHATLMAGGLMIGAALAAAPPHHITSTSPAPARSRTPAPARDRAR